MPRILIFFFYTVTVPHHKKMLIHRATSAYLHSHMGSRSISEEF